jgi:PEP-CTERM motif
VSTYTGKTTVTGGTLTLDGANRLSSSSGLGLNGGTLKLLNAGGMNGQTFSSLSLTDNSTIDLGSSSLTFFALATVAAGKSLSVIDYSSVTSPEYAFRFLGDDTTSADFLTLIGETTVDGVAVAYRFDGTYTDVAPVPLPASLWMLMSGLGLFGAIGVRKGSRTVA